MRDGSLGRSTRRRSTGLGPGGAKTLTEFERDHIVATLERTYWRLEGEDGAAALLGINPSTLRSRMRKHGIRLPGRRTPIPPAAV